MRRCVHFSNFRQVKAIRGSSTFLGIRVYNGFIFFCFVSFLFFLMFFSLFLVIRSYIFVFIIALLFFIDFSPFFCIFFQFYSFFWIFVVLPNFCFFLLIFSCFIVRFACHWSGLPFRGSKSLGQGYPSSMTVCSLQYQRGPVPTA